MDDPRVAAAVIAGVVSLAGVAISILTTRWQLTAKLIELEQLQLQEVLAKRMEAYPKLWNVLLTYGRNWVIEGKPRDVEWSREFLRKLNECNAECGVFFSQPVYERFHAYRTALSEIADKLAVGTAVTAEEHQRLERISAGEDGKPGLGTQLKADLGSYRDTIFCQPK
jgi:hypothetical protein